MTPRELAEKLLRKRYDELTVDELSEALESYGREQRNQALEDAAKECDRVAGNTKDFTEKYFRRAAGTCGLAIRALKDEEKS